jgi:hypothetical protein
LAFGFAFLALLFFAATRFFLRAGAAFFPAFRFFVLDFAFFAFFAFFAMIASRSLRLRYCHFTSATGAAAASDPRFPASASGSGPPVAQSMSSTV